MATDDLLSAPLPLQPHPVTEPSARHPSGPGRAHVGAPGQQRLGARAAGRHRSDSGVSGVRRTQTRATFSGERQRRPQRMAPSGGGGSALTRSASGVTEQGGQRGSGSRVGGLLSPRGLPSLAQRCPPGCPPAGPSPRRECPPHPTVPGLLEPQGAGPAPGRAPAAPADASGPAAARCPPGASPRAQRAVPLRHHPRPAGGWASRPGLCGAHSQRGLGSAGPTLRPGRGGGREAAPGSLRSHLRPAAAPSTPHLPAIPHAHARCPSEIWPSPSGLDPPSSSAHLAAQVAGARGAAGAPPRTAPTHHPGQRRPRASTSPGAAAGAARHLLCFRGAAPASIVSAVAAAAAGAEGGRGGWGGGAVSGRPQAGASAPAPALAASPRRLGRPAAGCARRAQAR